MGASIAKIKNRRQVQWRHTAAVEINRCGEKDNMCKVIINKWVKNLFMLFAFLTILPTSPFAWSPYNPVNTHSRMAEKMVSDPRIHDMLLKLGFGQNQINDIVNKTGEPDDQSWGGINNWNSFRSKWGNIPPTKDAIWKLLHTISDASVPVTHGPAYEVFRNDVAQTRIEEQAAISYASEWPSPPYYTLEAQYYSSYPTYYNAYCNKFASVMVEYANQIKNYYNSTWYCPACDLSWKIYDCQRASYRLAREVVYAYLYCHYTNSWNNPFPQFSPNYPGYNPPYVTEYSKKYNTVSISTGDDMFFPVKYTQELESNYKSYTGAALIDWGDGSNPTQISFDVTKGCRTENLCKWESVQHTYNNPGTYPVKVSYQVKEYYFVTVPGTPTLIYWWSQMSINSIIALPKRPPDISPVINLLLNN